MLVTGAAGGIGSAMVATLAERGFSVAAVDLDPNSVPDGENVHAYQCDVTRSADVESVLDQVERKQGPIDGLVNAAGVLRHQNVCALSEDDWSAMFAVNVTGTFLVSRSTVNRMVPRKSGAIVTIASNAASTARMAMAGYAASKAAAVSFTKCLGLEVAQFGIRCNTVSPGSTDTSMLHSMWTSPSGRTATLDGAPSSYRVGIPLRKIAQPSDIADAALFLMSEKASHITMQELTVDGGATLGV